MYKCDQCGRVRTRNRMVKYMEIENYPSLAWKIYMTTICKHCFNNTFTNQTNRLREGLKKDYKTNIIIREG